MRAALRHLCRQGVEALQPTKTQSKAVRVGTRMVAKPSKEIWHRPLVSKRVGNDLRKLAIREGTYGSFNSITGVGWDPTWDLVLFANRYSPQRRIKNIQPSKKTMTQRNREERAQKIEQNLQGQAAQLEEYFTEKKQAKVQDKSFEARYKRMMRGVGGGSAGASRK